MILKTDKNTYTVHFRRTQIDMNGRTTWCVFHEGLCSLKDKDPNDMCVIKDAAQAMTKCSHKDQFVKDTGRKIALARALARHHWRNKTRLPDWLGWRGEREQIWRAYAKLTNAPWSHAS